MKYKAQCWSATSLLRTAHTVKNIKSQINGPDAAGSGNKKSDDTRAERSPKSQHKRWLQRAAGEIDEEEEPPAKRARVDEGVDELSFSALHTKAVREKLSHMELLPVEKPELAVSLTEIKGKIEDISSAIDENAVVELRQWITDCLEQVDQLTSSARTAAKDLSREQRKFPSSATKEKQETQAEADRVRGMQRQ